jgi:sec-independent protein translocase protein TatB
MGIESPVHLLFIAVVALIVLGPKRLPDLARALGQGIREFRQSLDEGASSPEPHAPMAQTPQPAQTAPPGHTAPQTQTTPPADTAPPAQNAPSEQTVAPAASASSATPTPPPPPSPAVSAAPVAPPPAEQAHPQD